MNLWALVDGFDRLKAPGFWIGFDGDRVPEGAGKAIVMHGPRDDPAAPSHTVRTDHDQVPRDRYVAPGAALLATPPADVQLTPHGAVAPHGAGLAPVEIPAVRSVADAGWTRSFPGGVGVAYEAAWTPRMWFDWHRAPTRHIADYGPHRF